MKTLWFIFFVVVIAIIAGIFWIDAPIANFVYSQGWQNSTLLMYLRLIGEAHWIIPALIAVLILWTLKKHFTKAQTLSIPPLWTPFYKIGFVISGILLSGIVTAILKTIFGRPRPEYFIYENVYEFQWWEFDRVIRSFPSGHATTEAALLTGIALVWPGARTFCIIVALLWLPSSFLIHAHWFSDVIGGAAVGFFVTLLLWKWLNAQPWFSPFK